MTPVQNCNLFDFSHTLAAELLQNARYPFEVLPKIGQTILQIGKTLNAADYHHPAPDVWIAKTATVAPTVSIQGPCIIGPNTEVRQCAFIRGNALVGENCVVGNSTELKNVILFDGVQVPHYNYVGDSILGYRAHMGAGSITSNVKSNRSLVEIKHQNETLKTELKKVGAFLGDFAEIGCNSVLNPGTVIGRNSQVYPLCSVRGVVPENSIFKGPQNVVTKQDKL